ncbi:Tm-1-like ATP-binding domain-containing protein [Flaviflexus massiliensis]|uniref:Tm-1-like ATP-binding domain-containing protein n=1 Tax=Flaviflexus massiliensis TaxID=1522309 RepID=UPI00097D9479|nr:Tm-1-like ATP-binding domain-containing protein [Flaviflexus massiliensis]
MGDVIVIGTIDTKEAEVCFVVDELEKVGATWKVINIGVFETESSAVPVSVGPSELAGLAGEDIHELRRGGEQGSARARALDAMAKGLAIVLERLNHEGNIGAVLGFGGSSGSSVIGRAMQVLPVGVPKVLVSTMASGDVTPYVGTRDISLMYSVTDIAGLNRISRRVLRNASRAAAGMAEGYADDSSIEESGQPLVAISMFGVTTPAVMAVQAGLESRGFETTVFHATGAGGRAMEGLVSDNLVDAVIDLTTSELTDELVGGVLTAGPNRMEAAGLAGIPQVLVPGALEVINFGAEHTVPKEFQVPERRVHVHNSAVTICRTNIDESTALGKIFTQKANIATGPTVVVIPLRGLSALGEEGQPYYDPIADGALFDEIRAGLRDDIPIVEVDAPINSTTFTDAVLAEFTKLWEKK